MKDEIPNRPLIATMADLVRSVEEAGQVLYSMQEDLYGETDDTKKISKANTFVETMAQFLYSEHVIACTDILFRRICCKYGLDDGIAFERSSTLQKFSAKIAEGGKLIVANRMFLEELSAVKSYSQLSKHEKNVLLDLICWADSFFRAETGAFWSALFLLKKYYDPGELVDRSCLVWNFNDGPHSAPTFPVAWKPVCAPNDPPL